MVAAQSTTPTVAAIGEYRSESARWKAVATRDANADGRFWFAVVTTGVYCYPSCAARRPLRRNVSYFESREAAEHAGFRPCRRCRPESAPRRVRIAQLVARACRRIEASEREPSLAELAADAQLSPSHFQRCFKEIAGISPKQYALCCRAERLRSKLGERASITAAIYDAGYNSSSRHYERSTDDLGMAPRAFASGGAGVTIRWDIADSWLGRVLVAATERGVCAIAIGDTDAELVRELASRFPRAARKRAEADSGFCAWFRDALALVAEPGRHTRLPLDVAGTAFQRRVWAALREIPPGQTRTYRAVAERIGQAGAARAVANACASNPAAVAIPCHRVIGSDRSLRGYRWGEHRKKALLDEESGE